MSFMIQKRSSSLSTKFQWNFYEIIKIRFIVINNVNFQPWIFTLKCHENFSDNLTKTKLEFGENEQALGLIIRED